VCIARPQRRQFRSRAEAHNSPTFGVKTSSTAETELAILQAAHAAERSAHLNSIDIVYVRRRAPYLLRWWRTPHLFCRACVQPWLSPSLAKGRGLARCGHARLLPRCGFIQEVQGSACSDCRYDLGVGKVTGCNTDITVHRSNHTHRTFLHINVKRFRGGLVFKAHRLLYHSTLGLRVIKKKKKTHISRYTAEITRTGPSCRLCKQIECVRECVRVRVCERVSV